tara:strand:+ start:53 stop:331 length:279 start_codon:yes stop_codon:yes gene_type:complete
MDEPKNYAEAVVLCRDYTYRKFVAHLAYPVLHWEGRKYMYFLQFEPDFRGFVTMRETGGDSRRRDVLAPDHMQPIEVKAETRAGRWDWKVNG